MLHCVRGGNPIVLPKRKTRKGQVKPGFVAGVEADEPFLGIITFLLTARCLGEKKHRFLLSGGALENGQSLLPGLLKFARRCQNRGQFRTGTDIIGNQFPCFQKERSRSQGSPLFIPYGAQSLDRGCILRIRSEHVQVLDLRFVEVAGLEITISPAQQTGLLRFGRTADEDHDHNGRESPGSDAF